MSRGCIELDSKGISLYIAPKQPEKKRKDFSEHFQANVSHCITELKML